MTHKRNLNIALIGYGKMGRLIDQLAVQKGHTIVARVHPTGSDSSITEQTLRHADVCIDFSHPEIALDNIKKMAHLKKNIVMGTTGWYEHLEEVKDIVAKHAIGFLYAPNFSIGVSLFLKIVEEAASLINPYDEYDVGGFESHHSAKADAPSGTAKAIMQTILSQMPRKKPDDLHFSSLRCGSIPGTHTVVFDSPADTITLTHQARNREGFARGSITAAEWLQGKTGFYTLQEML